VPTIAADCSAGDVLGVFVGDYSSFDVGWPWRTANYGLWSETARTIGGVFATVIGLYLRPA